MYLTLLATNWYIPFGICYNIMHRYHDIGNGNVFKQLRHAMQGRTMQKRTGKILK